MKPIYNTYEAWYMEQMGAIVRDGQYRGDRTGTGVYSKPFLNYTHDLRESYPLLNGRWFDFQKPITEIIWMMSGSSNIQYLVDNACPFWNSFATPTELRTPVELKRTERLVIHANNRGVSVGETLTSMANVPLEEIDALLDKYKVPNTRDEITPKGELGPVYGVMWRNWPNPDGTTFDQLVYALNVLKKDPNSRRIVVDCWNPSFLPDPSITPAQNAANGKMALTPCHFTFGFYTCELSSAERADILAERYGRKEYLNEGEKQESGEGDLLTKYRIPTHYLDISFVMRSNDWILGQPANMNMYSAMLMIFAKQLNMVPRYVNYTGWDSHVYSNHLNGMSKLFDYYNSKEYSPWNAVKMKDIPLKGLFDYHHTDFELDREYKCGPVIKFPIAI